MHRITANFCHIFSGKETYLHDTCIILSVLPFFYLVDVTGVVILQQTSTKISHQCSILKSVPALLKPKFYLENKVILKHHVLN